MNETEVIFDEALNLQKKGRPFALATIAAARGSTPRERARILVRADGSTVGTIGGGLLESKVVTDALLCIKENSSRLVQYALDSSCSGESVMMECGGSLTVFIDVVGGKQELVIIGAGHVGLAVAKIADFCGFRVVVVDERPGLATSERFPMAAELLTGEGGLKKILEALGSRPASVFVIATHSDDESALRFMLRKEWSYLGLLGSKKKVAKLFSMMREEGTDPAILDKVRAPIGLEIGAETPEEIAVSVIAEILSDTRKASSLHLSEIQKG